ncbi:hypothetical protein [Nitrosomonas communis]|uniref:Uncharacterized protein n=1 Tax=Nitrosomonas communis TaxID=44574 RepID=A0A1I4UAG1_9PROT|nr:hypothetical protein [Nitrosomonas communis]SFM85986.1 hypothetical protein SAMN05421863_10626 [Nitrosomonas communis]
MNVYLEIDKSLNESLRIWRYMGLAKLISLFETKALWLVRADTFKDKHEGRFPDEMRASMESAYKNFPKNNPSPVKDYNDFQDYLIKKHLY